MLQQLKLPPFVNVAANGIATMQLPAGPTYESIDLVLGGGAFTKPMITLITIKVNGKIVFQVTGSRLDSINTYKGLPVSATALTIPFTEVKSRDRFGQMLGAYSTAAGLANVVLEVTIAGATTPTLDAYATASGPRDGRNPVTKGILKLINMPVTYAAAGKQYWMPWPARTGPLLLKRMYFFHANLTALEVRQNGIVIAEPVLAVNSFQQAQNGKTAQAGLYVHDFCLDQNVEEAISPITLDRFEFFPTLSAADTLNVYAECVDALANI